MPVKKNIYRANSSGYESPRKNGSHTRRGIISAYKVALFTSVLSVTMVTIAILDARSQLFPRHPRSVSKKYEDITTVTNGFVLQLSEYGRFSNLEIELLNLALMARALNRVAISVVGLKYLTVFDLDELNKVASGHICDIEKNPETCCRVRGWHYDKDQSVINFIEGRDHTVPKPLKDRRNWSSGCRVLFDEHRADSTDGLRITELVSRNVYANKDCGESDAPICVTADMMEPLHAPPLTSFIPVLGIHGRLVFGLNVADELDSQGSLQMYLNLLQSVSPPTLPFSSTVINTAAALYQYSLEYASIQDNINTVGLHMRLEDVAAYAPTVKLWKMWVSMAHPNSKVAFIGTNAVVPDTLTEIKSLFPDTLIGCPEELFPQCFGPMQFGIEQTAMTMYTYFGGFKESTYSSNIATHRLLLGHSIYSTMAFKGNAKSLDDMIPFQRMDSGFGVQYTYQ